MASVYLIVNRKNGSQYIGMTSQPVPARFRQHLSAALRPKPADAVLQRAIRKHGHDAFAVFTIRECEDVASARSAEIELIAKWRPRYNQTSGGEGNHGMSPLGRAKMSAASRGNTHNRGRRHRPEVVEGNRRRALQDRDAWMARRHLGPAASAKRVVCIEDGLAYESASAAARAYGVSRSALIEICCGNPRRKTIGGLTFRYETAG